MQNFLLRLHFRRVPSLEEAVDTFVSTVLLGRSRGLIPDQMYPTARSVSEALVDPLLEDTGDRLRRHILTELETERYHILSIWGGDPDHGTEITLMDNSRKFLGRYFIGFKLKNAPLDDVQHFAAEVLGFGSLSGVAVFDDNPDMLFRCWVDQSGTDHQGKAGAKLYVDSVETSQNASA